MSTLRKIKFLATGHSLMVGSFSNGDEMRVRSDYAKHFVEEARIAEYLDADPSTAQTGAPDVGQQDLSKLTVEQLKAALTEKGIEIPAGVKKADLIALLSTAG
jgi:hypothetical protein